MRIAVIGAGIAGLVAACSLQQDGHEVTVYEQRPYPSAEGAGITLFGNAMTALEAVGLGQLIRNISSTAMSNMRTGQRDPSGQWLVNLHLVLWQVCTVCTAWNFIGLFPSGWFLAR